MRDPPWDSAIYGRFGRLSFVLVLGIVIVLGRWFLTTDYDYAYDYDIDYEYAHEYEESGTPKRVGGDTH